MSDTREIDIKFNAETKTAQENAAALSNYLQAMQDRVERNREALRRMTDELDSAFSKLANSSAEVLGNESAANVFSKEIDNAQKMAGNAEVKLQGLLDSISKFKEELSAEGVDNSLIDSLQPKLEQLKTDLDRIAGATATHSESISKLTNSLLETQQAFADGLISPLQAETLSKLNAEILKTSDLLRELQQVGGESIIDPGGTTRSLDELAQTLAKLKAAKDAISSGDTSGWLNKWASDTKDSTDKIVAAYDKAAAKEAAAHAKAKAAAEAKIEKIEEANEREGASIAELTALLNELLAARKAARKAEDTVEEARLAEAIRKTSAELDKKQRAYDRTAAAAEKAAEREAAAAEKAAEKEAAAAQKATSRQTAAMKRAGDQATQSLAGLARMMATGTLTARGLATSIRGIGTALKTGFGPIGLAVLATEALIYGLQKLFDWWKDTQDAAEESAKKQAEAMQEASRKAVESEREMLKAQQDIETQDTYGWLTRKIKEVNEALGTQLQLSRESLDIMQQQKELEMDAQERKVELDRVKLERRKAEGLDQETYTRELRKLEDRLTNIKRRRERLKLDTEQQVNTMEKNEIDAGIEKLTKQVTLLKGILNNPDMLGGKELTALLAAREEARLKYTQGGEGSTLALGEFNRLTEELGAAAKVLRDAGLGELADALSNGEDVSGRLSDILTQHEDALADLYLKLTRNTNAGKGLAMTQEAIKNRYSDEDAITRTNRSTQDIITRQADQLKEATKAAADFAKSLQEAADATKGEAARIRKDAESALSVKESAPGAKNDTGLDALSQLYKHAKEDADFAARLAQALQTRNMDWQSKGERDAYRGGMEAYGRLGKQERGEWRGILESPAEANERTAQADRIRAIAQELRTFKTSNAELVESLHDMLQDGKLDKGEMKELRALVREVAQGSREEEREAIAELLEFCRESVEASKGTKTRLKQLEDQVRTMKNRL